MKWEVEVTSKVTTRLRVRTGPGLSYRIVNWKYKGNKGVVVDSKTVGNLTWYKWEGTSYWSCGIEKGVTYLKKIKDLEEKPAPKPEPAPEPAPPVEPPLVVDTGNINYGNSTGKDANNNLGGSGYYTWYEPNYKSSGSFADVDYVNRAEYMILREISKIKANMDICYKMDTNNYSTFESTNENRGYFTDLQKKMYNSFNRNKIALPDKELNKTFAYVFFTRPDLNILELESGTTNLSLTDQTRYDKKYFYLWNNNPWCLKSLVDAGNPYHKLMVLLSNEALSFEVGDIVLKTEEHGETYNGHKIMYGRSDIESNIAGEVSIRYVDTINLDVFKLHTAWVDYISKVSRGVFYPKREYIKKRILDYACSCYYFLCGPDGSTILYWQKLTGVFPLNTGENTFSWDSGTLLAKPEINIKYAYSFKSAMDPITLFEFNNLTFNGVHKTTYEKENLHTGSTFTHSPRVWESTDPAGHKIFRLIWVENKEKN